MRGYGVKKSIQAQPERIWQLLTEAGKYPDWNSAVDSIDGRIAPGESITVHVPNNPGRTFPVKVTSFDKPRRMVWTGGMPLGLFKGVRTFELTPDGNGSTSFSMEEAYSGALAGMMFKQIPDLNGPFEQFASSLKKAAESNPKAAESNP